MVEAERYRPVLFLMVWFFLLSLYAIVFLRDESSSAPFKAALLATLLSLLGIAGLAAKIRRELRKELG